MRFKSGTVKTCVPKPTNPITPESSHPDARYAWGRYLEEKADNKKVALQLGTLGGGNHFLEVRSVVTHCSLCRCPGQRWGFAGSGSADLLST